MPVTIALSLVQLNTVPTTLPDNTIVAIDCVEQIVCDDGAATALGVGFTTTIAVITVPVQPVAVGVIVNVTVIGALVALVKVPLILPTPILAMPVTPGLSLV